MSPLNFTHILTQAVDELSESESYKGLFHQHKDGEPLPSAKVLYEIIELSRSILFPGYYGNSTINSRTINYHIGVNIEKLFDLLTEQILAGLCFGTSIEGRCNACSDSKREEAARLAAKFISKLPVMRRVLATDVEAAYNGDPAAESYGEVIFCYPAIKASGRQDWQSLHDRPRHRCGNRRNEYHRKQRQTLSGRHSGSQEFPAGCGWKANQRHPAPPDTGRQCNRLFQRHYPGKNHYRTRCNRRR